MFLDSLLGLAPKRKQKFNIELALETKAPYKMIVGEL